MAGNPNGYISKFKPASFFFTDPIALAQSSAQAFGPVSTDLTNKYRLTTKFNISAGKAYAVCKGVVLVQPQTGQSGKVNVILRPYIQPINGINIKYFIYRGLNKSDFFTGDQVIAAGTSTSDFINRINTNFTNYYIKITQPKPSFLAKYIGFDPANQADAIELSDFFFKDSIVVDSSGQVSENDAFELPMIDAGNSLGSFVPGECGFDVVLSYGDYKLPAPDDEFVFDLTYARAPEAIITLTGGMSDYQKKLKREQIFQFLDAAAYYGFHANENGAVQVKSGGSFVKKEGIAVYNDVISGFNTKNSIYLYIQSDRGRSYNFYDNYRISDTNVNNLKFGITSDNLTEAVYGVSGWPVIINKLVQTHSYPKNSFYLQLVLKDTVNAMLYGQIAMIDNAQKNNFFGIDSVQQPDNMDGTTNPLTKVIEISNLNIGANGAKLSISSFNIIIYTGSNYLYTIGEVIDDNGATKEVESISNSLDNVFGNVDSKILFNSINVSTYVINTHYRLSLVSHIQDNNQLGISAVQTVIINDEVQTSQPAESKLARVSFITQDIDNLNSFTGSSNPIFADQIASSSLSRNVKINDQYYLSDLFSYQNVSFTDESQPINGVRLVLKNELIPSKIIIGITKEEYKRLLEDLPDGSVNHFLCLVNLSVNNGLFTSPEGVKYSKYILGITSEITDSKLKLFLPSSDVKIYNVVSNYFFSEHYSRYLTPDLSTLRGDTMNENTLPIASI